VAAGPQERAGRDVPFGVTRGTPAGEYLRDGKQQNLGADTASANTCQI
ncbi:putative tyrosine recombinase, partial [Bordetella avium 197N]